jgi:hypothetical protein
MATRLQIKRSTVSGITPTTGDIVIGELAINLADRKLFTSNGTLVYELGSNLTNLSVTGNTTLTGVIANGSLGTAGQTLHSNGSVVYWDTDNQGVTSVATGNGLTGGPITATGTVSVLANSGIVANTTGVYVRANNGITVNATGVYVTQGTGAVVNTTGVHVNTAFIGTLTANNTNNLNGQPASFYTNATNITSGTLATARLPATANIATIINVGANINLSTTRINVGNTTVNVAINSTSISVTSDPLVQQSDIGTDPNQIPLNQYLGSLAYQSPGPSNTSSNGFSYILNNILVQWGTVSSNSSSGSITWPRQFQTLLNIQTTSQVSAWDQTYLPMVISSNTTTANIVTGNATSTNVYFLAVGL